MSPVENQMDAVQQLQSDQYSFPYHYLANLDGEGYSGFRSWDWSLSYATALRLILDKLKGLGTTRHIDIGCGDGALVHHLNASSPNMHLSGIDYDPQAIAFARLLNPHSNFICGDITGEKWPEPFDTATMVEVIEHIEPDFLPDFLAAARQIIKRDGHLIVTVPHANKPVAPKHYRHFTFETLRAALSPSFEVHQMIGFERLDKAKSAIQKIFDNPWYFAELKIVNRLMLARELAFAKPREKGCGRILAVCSPSYP